MADLDLDGVRERLTFAEAIRLVDDKPEHPVYESQGDVAPLLAEIARLRTIAAPLERLEAWRRADVETRRFYVIDTGISDELCAVLCGGWEGRGYGKSLHEAVDSALDEWQSLQRPTFQPRKDAPHA